ncbi:MAG TPA: DNA gyrase inhibitor YacG [Geminicoccus sp.]|jgi:hypothetical protein|uniref:DNA gyrase inhibitor YacG n=1 Tax=Geminicoccus sp. TaxID=2024832 RepID=UPI002E2FAA37|nr:DNA gyrase inhibitor YacG [Geminicoccus sp.]HEX2527466.1 DNA gyrase inhibitor YacG [Geminicoccus sp.]
MTELPTLQGRCPNCGKPRDHRFRPFCSRACRDRDFLAWANDRYAIPAVENTEDDGDQSLTEQDERDD